MKTPERFNIYECLDQSGESLKFICDGHVDSVTFRDKCFEEFYVKPLVIRHQWRKTRSFKNPRPGKKYGSNISGTVHCVTEEMGSVPITVGLV